MANESGADINPQDDVHEEVVAEESDDVVALKEKFEKVSDQNKQLFARAKKAEGFVLKDGQWVKSKVVEKVTKTETQKGDTEQKESFKPNELDYGQKAYLKTYGIQGSDELALVKTFQARTGDDIDTIVSDDIFLGKLNSLREAKQSTDAIPKGKGRSGQTGVTDVDIAVAKFKETGELPSDFELRRQVIDKAIVEPKNSNNALFSGK